MNEVLHNTMNEQPEHQLDNASNSAAEHSLLQGEGARCYRCTPEEFLENVIAGLPTKLLVLDQDLRVVHCNPAYYVPRGLTREEVEGKLVDEVFPQSLLEEGGLREALQTTLRTGERVRWSGYRHPSRDHGERIVNIRIDPCKGYNGEPNVLLTIEDVTERHRQLYERTILQQITRAMLGQLELPRLLHAILTGVTAGGAVGLGFNRAIMMLADEEEGILRAEMAVGPECAEEASQIWSQLGDQHHTLDEFLSAYDKLPPPEERPLRKLVERLVVPLSQTDVLPMSAIARGETIHVEDAANDPQVPAHLYELLGAEEFVVAPMVAKDKIIGVVIADNFVTRRPITASDIQMLTALANQAALSIDSARMYQKATRQAEELAQAYEELQKAHRERIRSEKLAAVGQVTTIVAHEIRNPLATIGGFARAIARDAEPNSRIKRNAQIIVEEVKRLESILSDLLDFTKPQPSQLVPTDPRVLIVDVINLLSSEIEAAGIETRLEFDSEPLIVPLDERLFPRVLINIVKNAIEAMPNGGTLTIGLHRTPQGIQISIADTGPGIPEDELDDIFDAFHTTKATGTGLGLALSKEIVSEHGAELSVSSTVGSGTTFYITFPQPADEADNPADAGEATHS